jgi:flagellar motor switch protein FliG
MKNKNVFIVFSFVWALMATGQSLDTITDNLQSPAVLDILSNRPIVNNRNSDPQESKVIPKGAEQKRNVRRKTVTEKAPQEKSILMRAITQFAPEDQFNVSAFRELTYEISDYTTQNIELPGVLGERVRTGDGSVELIKEKTIVRLELDTAGIAGDIGFFERLVYNTLDLDLAKDEVSVKIWEFPYSAARKAKKVKQTSENNTQAAEVLVVDDIEESGPSIFTKWWFWVALAVLLGLIIFLIIRFRKGKNNVEDDDLSIDNSSFKKMSLNALDKAPVSLEKSEFKKLLVESPESVSLFMENIIETGQEEALTVFAMLAKPYPDLVGQMKPHMSYSSYLMLLNKVDEDIEEKIDPDTQDKFLLTFNNTVKALSNEKNSVDKTPDHKVFGFLTQLNDIQIFKLIEGDKPELSSVLFAQLPDDRKLKIMELLDAVERGEMLLKLTDMSRLPLSVIRDIGQRYAKKAKEMAGLYNIDIDGIGAIINTLDELEENKQKEILETMLQNDLDKGQIVEQKFIGFFNLHKMDQEILQNALMDFETEELLNALFGADNATVEAILNTRPPREGEMIRSELESGKTVSNISRAKARKSILARVRKFV